jgi:hypothetical protein
MRNLSGQQVSWPRLEHKPTTITVHYPVSLEIHYIKERMWKERGASGRQTNWEESSQDD